MAQLEITAMTFGPFGVGRLDGQTVMVPNAAPGDLLEVEITSRRRDYAFARLVSVMRPGPHRRVPPCPFLPRCGGCDWQHIEYSAQVAIKAELIVAEVARTLGVTLDPGKLMVAAPAEFGYRARIRLKAGPGGKLGFNELQSNALVEIDRCLVAAEGLSIPREFARALGRNLLELEVAAAGSHQVLIAHLARAPRPTEIARAREYLDRDPAIAGIVLRANETRIVLGDAQIAVGLESDLDLMVDADLFSQVNHAQNRRLIAHVLATAQLRAGTKVLDLYCGAGNFSLPAARHGAEVTGVDAEPHAIAAAQQNATRLGLDRARFIATRAEESAQFMLRARYQPELVILDPPRSGALELMDLIARLRPPAVIYVSCNLTTLVRDLRALFRAGYRLNCLRAFDFFPNTHHGEIVAHAVLT